MHVQLWKSVADKMLVLSGKSGKSVNEVVNIVLDSLDEVNQSEEIHLVISSHARPPAQEDRKPVRIVRRIHWSAKL